MATRRINTKIGLRKSSIYMVLSQYFTDAKLQRIARYYRQELRSSDRNADLVSGLLNMQLVLGSNPYLLSKVPRVTVTDIDSVVTDLPVDHPWHVGYDEQRRVDAMITAVLENGIADGEAIMSESEVLNQAQEALLANTPQMDTDVETVTLINTLQKWVQSSDVYIHVDGGIMSRDYYDQTELLAKHLIDRSLVPASVVDTQAFDEAMSKSAVKLSAEQQDVVSHLISAHVSLLTGYAGTGKSTLVQALTTYLHLTGQEAQLCAIAGKACFNLTQITKMPSRTIAGLVYAGAHLQASYLIIDEISMVSETNLSQLLSLLSPTTHVVMIGDPAQLPAVEGVGMLTALPAFLSSSVMQSIYTHTLTTVFRQGEGHLLDHATALRAIEEPTDFSDDATLKYRQVKNRQFGLAAYRAAVKNYHLENVSLITPLNEDVDWFNTELQLAFSKGKPVLQAHGLQFFEGDKVLVTHNMYNVELADSYQTTSVFNGFVGQVVKVDNDPINPYLQVLFKQVASSHTDLRVNFYVDDDHFPNDSKEHQHAMLDNLSLGYALTVHKSQGSTIPVVIYYLASGTSIHFLSRQLLYTALTRAKKLVFLTNQPVSNSLLLPYVNSDAYQYASSYLATALREAERHVLTGQSQDNDTDTVKSSDHLSDLSLEQQAHIDQALDKLFND